MSKKRDNEIAFFIVYTHLCENGGCFLYKDDVCLSIESGRIKEVIIGDPISDNIFGIYLIRISEETIRKAHAEIIKNQV